MLPTLVLLPGMDGTGALFTPFLAALGDEFETQVVRYPSDAVLSYVELTERVRLSLPQDKQFVIIAESFSGPIAISLAAEKPAGLVGLILCASFVRHPRPILGLFVAHFSKLCRLQSPRSLVHWSLLNVFAATEVSDTLDRALTQVQPKVLTERLRALADIDASEQLNEIMVPCLYLWATKDRVLPRAALQSFKLMGARWTIRELSGPHLLLQSAPIEAARAVREFVDGLPASEK